MSANHDPIPVSGLFEAHLAVADLQRAVAFYRDHLGLALAREFPSRRVAFFWMGAPGRTMLGLWESGTMPLRIIGHIAFQTTLNDLHAAPERLQSRGIVPRDFDGNPTSEPVVIAWMPAASVFFHDPDGNLLEYISMLPDDPEPDVGVILWSDWLQRKNNTAV